MLKTIDAIIDYLPLIFFIMYYLDKSECHIVYKNILLKFIILLIFWVLFYVWVHQFEHDKNKVVIILTILWLIVIYYKRNCITF